MKMFLYLTLLILLFSCSKAVDENTIFVAIPPYKDVTSQIVGNLYKVESLINEGDNPHIFSPTPKQVARLAKAKIFFTSGLEFEKALIPRIKKLNPDIKIVALQDGIHLRSINGHTHGENCSGHHEGNDPHIWLAPMLLKKQVKTIYNSITALDTTNSTQLKTNYQKLTEELTTLDTELQQLLSSFAGKKIYVYHPSFGYFCDAYNLRQEAIETGGKEPSTKALTKLIAELKRDSVKTIFVQKQFNPQSAKVIARESGCTVVPIQPMPIEYIKDMKELGAIIARELQK